VLLNYWRVVSLLHLLPELEAEVRREAWRVERDGRKGQRQRRYGKKKWLLPWGVLVGGEYPFLRGKEASC
jgi:hypothetical protein